MTGGAAAAQVIVIHRRQIIVHETVDVDELHRGGWGIELLEWRAQGLPSDVNQ